MEVVADLHLHSKYSRAVSQRMVVEEMAVWAVKKGINLLGTADWTHPLWFKELRAKLEEVRPGLYKLKSADLVSRHTSEVSPLTAASDAAGRVPSTSEVKFILTTEIASIYTQGGKMRRIHNLVLASSFETVEKINAELTRRGVNLLSDGRPITGISARDLAALVLEIDEDCLVIPAHCWTPWFSLYGSKSGFDSVEECFGDYAKDIYGIETGLSSDPAMNWRVKDLDSRSILSFSDAHSPEKMGREATVFKLKTKNEKLKIDYKDIVGAIRGEGEWEISYTIEFYPEEGKYHYTGHRNCGVRQSPEETKKLGTTCAVCGKPLTVGVMHRVEQLAQREIKKEKLKIKNDAFGTRWIVYEERLPYAMLVPLLEILAEAKGSTVHSQSVMSEYERLVANFGGELAVLLKTEIEKIKTAAGERIAEGILRVRSGQVIIKPGYDGMFGEVAIWRGRGGDGLEGKRTNGQKQMSLF